MRFSRNSASLLLAGAAVLLLTAISGAEAMSVPARPAAGQVVGQVSSSAQVVKVHGHLGDRKPHRNSKWGHKTVVDAPFTRVRTGRRVEVDAPFTSVTVNRHGRHVRAPFVDLWLPRVR